MKDCVLMLNQWLSLVVVLEKKRLATYSPWMLTFHNLIHVQQKNRKNKTKKHSSLCQKFVVSELLTIYLLDFLFVCCIDG